jgi:hypothetical protein
MVSACALLRSKTHKPARREAKRGMGADTLTA